MDKNLFKDYLALVKVGIVQSNVFTTLTGACLALYVTGRDFFAHLDLLLFSVFGAMFVVAGACALNNYIDRDIDRLMVRTQGRPTITGTISNRQVLTVGFGFVAIGLLLLLLASFQAYLVGVFGVLVYVGLYSLWAKRSTALNTVIGGFSGAVPPLIGWFAVDPHLHQVAIGLFLLMFLWQPPHFYSLAMRRVEEYRKAGIPMLPVVKGFSTTKWHMVVWVAALFPIAVLLAPLGIPVVVIITLLNLGWLFFLLHGYRSTDAVKWASKNFIYSLNYLMLSFGAMLVVAIIRQW